jgi:hypothetical protein
LHHRQDGEQQDGEHKDGWKSAARQGLLFYARCAHEAWRRSWDAGKALPPILALLVLYAGARAAGIDLTFPGGETDYGMAIGTGLFIAGAWGAVFLVQLIAAPPRLYARLGAQFEAERRRVLALPAPAAKPSLPQAPVPTLALPAPIDAPEIANVEAIASAVVAEAVEPFAPEPVPVFREPMVEGAFDYPPIDHPPVEYPSVEQPPIERPVARRPKPATLGVRLHDQVYATAERDTTGALLPPSRAYMARITNRGDRTVRRCQLFFGSATHIQVVSGPFDLKPGAHRDLPALRVIDESDEPHALLYFLDRETWDIAAGQAAWLPEPGRFKVKVLSANAPESAVDVALACSESEPLAWTLIEAAAVEPAKAAPAVRASRKRRGWAAVADVVADPSSGD